MTSQLEQSLSDLGGATIRKELKESEKEFLRPIIENVFKRMLHHIHLYIRESKSKINVFVITADSLKYLSTSPYGKPSKYHGSQPISKSVWYGELEDDLDGRDIEDIKKRLGEKLEHKGIPLPKNYNCMENGKNIWHITDKKENNIYYVIKKENGKLNVYSEPIDLNTFRDDLLENIRSTDEQGVKNLGSILRFKLIPNEIQATLKEELQSGNEKIEDVWVSCEGLDSGYLWEWIYWEERDFFWGDRFYIVRIPKSCEFKNSNPFKISKIALLEGINCTYEANKDFECIKSETGVIPVKKSLNNREELVDLKGFDLIHVVADAKHDNEIQWAINDAKLFSKQMSDSSPANRATDHKFLFLNIFNSENPGRMCESRSKLIELIPANMWICSSWNVSKDFALKFTKDFYESVIRERSVVVAATRAREKSVDEEFWRLAYIVEGDPCTEITWPGHNRKNQ